MSEPVIAMFPTQFGKVNLNDVLLVKEYDAPPMLEHTLERLKQCVELITKECELKGIVPIDFHSVQQCTDFVLEEILSGNGVQTNVIDSQTSEDGTWFPMRGDRSIRYGIWLNEYIKHINAIQSCHRCVVYRDPLDECHSHHLPKYEIYYWLCGLACSAVLLDLAYLLQTFNCPSMLASVWLWLEYLTYITAFILSHPL